MPSEPNHDEILRRQRKGRVYFDWDPRKLPIPRCRMKWEGPHFAYITLELSERYSDAVVGVTWELPSWLSARVDHLLKISGFE